MAQNSNDTAVSSFKKVKRWASRLEKHFRETTFYFSVKPRNAFGQTQITFSSQCSLYDFFARHFRPLEAATHWIFFMGTDAKLTPDILAQHRIPFTLLDFYNQTLFVCTPGPDQKTTLAELFSTPQEFWLLGLDFAPTPEDLKAMGILARSNAFRDSAFDLRGGFLLNFFPDASFSGHEAGDFLSLITLIFDIELTQHFDLSATVPSDPAALALSTLRPLDHLDIVLDPLTSPAHGKTLLIHFTVFGYPKITISKLRWPSGKRFDIFWMDDHWSHLTEKKFGTFKTAWDLITSYFWPVLLFPVAVVIIPLTLLLLPFYQIAKKVRLRARPEDADE